jgi:hypothetical protein
MLDSPSSSIASAVSAEHQRKPLSDFVTCRLGSCWMPLLTMGESTIAGTPPAGGLMSRTSVTIGAVLCTPSV